MEQPAFEEGLLDGVWLVGWLVWWLVWLGLIVIVGLLSL
jgi:hypothetical protein